MKLKFDLSGKRFGKWTIISRLPREKGSTHQIKWLCRCECGTEIIRGSNYIRKDWISTDCGCSRSLVGQKFSSLLIIERLGKDSRHEANYVCLCDCGVKKTFRGKVILAGRVRSCGCRRKKNITENGRSLVRNAYKTNAKKRGLCFELTKQVFDKMIESPCHFCGKTETNFTHAYKRGYGEERYFHNGVDRLDNEKGYTIANSVPCCKYCNHMKWNLSFKEWIEHMESVLNHQQPTAQAV